MALVRKAEPGVARCFSFFNPMDEASYQEVVGRWFAILLHTLRHIADPGHPSQAKIEIGAGGDVAGRVGQTGH